MENRKFSRRDFIKAASLSTAAVVLAACAPAVTPKPQENGVPTTVVPAAKGGKVVIAVGGWAVDSTKAVVDKLGFISNTGITVDVQTRPGTLDQLTTMLTSAIASGSSPYDVLDFEDEAAATYSRAGFFQPLDDLLPADFWGDFPQTMIDMAEIWDKYEGKTFRIHHNYEACYSWYRKDLFDAKGIAAPKTWDDVAALGKTFTDEAKNAWATEDGLTKGGMMNVYLAYLTKQAGGNPFDVDDKFKTALEYFYKMMYQTKAFNPAALQKNYDQVNADYTEDRVAYMRQWPFFYDVARAKKDWFKEEKAVVILPPVGPGGAKNSTYAAGWGFGILKNATNLSQAKQLLQFLVDKKNAGEMAKMNTWFLINRKSVLNTVGDAGMAKYLKMYSEAGVIGTRPFHPKFVEALAVLEDSASAYLSKQINLDQAMKQAQDGMKNVK
jgi:multiple sugar transport system substrate-binding protein